MKKARINLFPEFYEAKPLRKILTTDVNKQPPGS